MAEWLRRLTRNQIPSGSVGSNPTDCEKLFHLLFVLERMNCPSVLSVVSWHRWFSGRMLACHAGGPGSIPGRCNCIFFYSEESLESHVRRRKSICGGAGYRSPYLSHAKRALYHLSYTPSMRVGNQPGSFCQNEPKGVSKVLILL